MIRNCLHCKAEFSIFPCKPKKYCSRNCWHEDLRKERAPLDSDRARTLFEYDPETGALRWRDAGIKIPKRLPGSLAGAKTSSGHLSVTIDGKSYLVHRVVWLHVHGIWPTLQIDHINGVPDDNRIANLREVEARINSQNIRRPFQGNKTGLLGVCRHSGRFVAQISVNGKRKHLGMFATAEEAHVAYLEAKRRLHKGCTI